MKPPVHRSILRRIYSVRQRSKATLVLLAGLLLGLTLITEGMAGPVTPGRRLAKQPARQVVASKLSQSPLYPGCKFTKQPVGGTVTVGGSFTFVVETDDDQGFTDIQWYRDLGSGYQKIAGANSETLTISNACSVCDAGKYRAHLSNPLYSCSADSDPATLVVNQAGTAIVTQPAAQQVCEGATAAFSVGVTGTVSAYQWYRNGTAIAGATAGTYSVVTGTANNGDKYKVVVTGTSTLTSNEVTLTVQAKPAITVQPVGATRCVGDNYTFTVTATNADSYQWQKDGAKLADSPGDISGSATNQLTLTNLCATCDPGSYVVRVGGRGSCSSEQVSSTAAVLVVNTPVSIITQPIALTVCEGSPSTFIVSASGTITGYQWYKNGVVISGATTNSYQLTTGTVNNEDKYKVEVQGPCGNLTSTEVTLTVNTKPTITAQPIGAIKCVGDNYTFSVTATNAGSYQWQKDEADLSGATGSSLVLTNLCSSCDAGTYQVVMHGAGACSAQQVVSNPATLLVNDPVGVTTQPVAQTVCEATSVSFAVSATGTITSYQWYRNGTAINGATSATYQLTTNAANNSDKYKVAVAGPCGTVTSSEVTLGVQAKPSITLQPIGATKCVGDNYTFTATATKAGAYQWQKDGADISGATLSTLTLTPVQPASAGSYVVKVNGAGACSTEQVVSNGAVLSVNTPVIISTPPAPLAVCEGTSATFSVQPTGTITGYQWYRNGTAITGATSNSYQFTTSTSGNGDKYKVEVQGPCGNLTSTEVILTVNAKPAITLQPTGATKCVGENYTFSVTATNAGSYQWQKDGVDLTGATSPSLVLTNLQTAGAGSYQVRVGGAGACSAEQVVSNQATLVINTPVSITTQPNAVTVCEGTSATFSVQAAGTITGYQWYRNGTAISGATTNSYQLTTGATNNGDKYKVEVQGPCGNLTSSEVTLGVLAKPVITLQPIGATKCVGGNYTFSVTATNAGSYQWQKDGADLSGATGSSLVLTNLCSTCDAGSYRVVVNGAGACSAQQVVSNPATLLVNDPVGVTTQPVAQTVCEATSVSFVVSATGTITSYQWYRNGSAITGATTNSYQLTAGTANNADKYRVEVQGPCGNLTSTEVTLTVNTKPVITVQPTGATKCAGDNYTFGVTVTNAGSYQWQRNGTDVVGATSASLILTSIQQANADSYRVRVGGTLACSAEQILSNEAVLVVNNPVTVITQPNTVTVCEGASATFSIQAAGTITGYQWYRNGSAITGATANSYQLTTGAVNNGNKYKVEVQGPCGNLTSTEVTLTVNTKPAITVQPAGAIKCVGETYTFAISASSVGSYQWQKNGVDVAGATSANLVLNPLSVTSAGMYRVRVTGAATCNGESLVSNEATLQVNTPVAITTQPVAQQVCEGSTGAFTVQANGTITGYQWYRNGTAITGATSASYQFTTSTANNDDKYKVDVQGPCGTVTSSEVTLGVQVKPAITLQPTGATKCVGENYTFTATATNAGSYQWQKDGADISGATLSTLTLTPVQPASAGSYVVKVSGTGSCAAQSVVSNGAVLVVNTSVSISTQPIAVSVCEGTSATFSVVATGTITGYQWYRNGSAITGATTNSYQLTTITTNNNDKYKVEVAGPCGNLTSTEAGLTVNAKPVITLQPVGATKCVGDGYTFSVTASNAGGYQWQKDGADISGATSTTLVLATLQPASAGSYQVRVTGLATCAAEQFLSNMAALRVNQPIVITTQPAVQQVCEGNAATFTVQATGTITTYQWYRNGVAINGATSSSYQFVTSTANNNEQYKVDVQGSCGTETSTTVALTVNAKPVITAQPVGSAKCVGEGYTFTLTASGIIASYQWQRNGIDIAGATAATYTLAAIQPGDAGLYQVVLTGAATCRSERFVSAGAALVVNVPILITTPLVSQTICEGNPVTFAPTATGTITGYRWYRNGQLLSTTDPTYTLTATLTNQNDKYRVELTGPCGTVTTAEATLAVIRTETPTITTNKPDGMCTGEQTTLTASGCTGTVTWFLSGNAVGTGSTFTTGQAGAYTASCANQGCTLQPRSNAIQVIQLSPVTFTAAVQNATCFAGNNGSVTITPGGAAGTPYTVRWTNPAGLTNLTIGNLTAGTYAFTITDRAGCTLSGTQAVTQPTQPSGSVVATDVTCNGQKDGRLVINARSDYGGYTYSMNGGTPVAFSAGATQTLTNLDQGTYTVRIADARNCEVLATSPVTINQPPALIVLAGLVKQPLSADSKDGSVEVSASGGTGPYTVRWYDASATQLTTQVQTTSTATGVISRLSSVEGGVYRVVVSDKNGCEQTQTQTLVAPPQLVTTITTKPISCFGRNDGTATVSVVGGVAFTSQPAYRIGWRRQGTATTISEGLTISGLAPGTYEATITDANGISTTATVPLTEPALLKTTVSQVLPNYCTSLPLGEVTLQTEGGRAPYRITWNGNAITGSTVTRLPGGRQIFTVTDASGCVATTEAVVPDNTTAFSTSIGYTAPTCFGRCDGTLISTVQGGNAPYQYSWRNLSVTTPTALSVCGTGETALTIQDAKGCVITSAVVSLTAPAPRVLGLPATQEVCPSKPFELSAASLTWGKTVIWTLPNSTTQTGATIQASGVGTYQVTVLDENSCGGQETILVRPFAAVKQLFTMPSEAVAGKSVVAIDLTSPNPTTIRWELPGGTLVSQDTYQAKLSFAKVGTFSVTEIATVDNCDYRLTKAIDIKASLDDNGFPRPMNVAPIEVTVMSNPTVGTTLQLAIANPADEDFSVTVQSITGHQRVFSQEYSKHGSDPLTVGLPGTVTTGLYILTVQTATVRITKHILVSR